MEQNNHGIDPKWLEALAEILGGPDGYMAAERFGNRMPSGYIERNSIISAGFDAQHIAELELGRQDAPSQSLANEGLSEGGSVARDSSIFGGIYTLAVPSPALDDLGHFQLRRYGFSSVELSEMVPVFESFGFKVVEVLPTLFPACGLRDEPVYLDDIRLRWADTAHLDISLESEADSQRLIEAMNAVDRSCCEVDLLNRLVMTAGLRWEQVELLRAYRQYRRQISAQYTREELDEALFAFPSTAAALVACFEGKFDPAVSSRDEIMAGCGKQVIYELSLVSDFDHDQILRGYLELINATVRTNYFLRDSSGKALPTLVVKLAASKLSGEILSHPLLETFVYSPGMEAVHLRAGLVARGGIRWSERIADFRTEVLGLAQAQIKKNAVIVPTGAKGGFVIRKSINPAPDEVLHAYQKFISSLLDVTDNLIDGQVVTPEGVVAFDGDDHYLVVAADKGTSSFSDVANAISIAKNFWLGDAFASGGTHGYDHKAMRITARGAWIAVQRHFEQLEMNVQSDTIKVVGVGDMSGDVFGNGMLQSQSIALVAAFDHRHIFIDPDPDPLISFGERQRLAALERSSWKDYDPKILSSGGGVWSRDSKEIPLHPRTKALLGLSAESLSPPELISAILQAPVDLIWFGGIGTYLKDRDESDADIGDPANNSVRITADKVRARVVAEGANLAATQRARMRYARRGGRINTDFIDNAAGVAISDREVNLKILLDLAIKERLLDQADRNSILAEASDEVAEGVLRQVDLSLFAITSAVPASIRELDAFEALVDGLASLNRLDRAAESLPSTEEFARRRENGAGLIRPELAILLSYSKLDLKSALVDQPLVDDPTLVELACAYFPNSVTQRFASLITKHALYRQLIATSLASEIVDRMGIVWARETAAEFNCTLAEVGGAFWASCKVLDAPGLWLLAENQDSVFGHETKLRFHETVAKSVDELARIYLCCGEAMAPSEVISRDMAPIASMPSLGNWSGRGVEPSLSGFLSDAGVAPEVTAKLSNVSKLPRLVEALEVSRNTGRSVDEVIAAFEEIDQVVHTAALEHLLEDIPANGRWVSWQIRGLRDDLGRWRVKVASSAMAASSSAGPKDAIQNWQIGQSRALAQANRLIDEAVRYANDRITLGSLALRSLHDAV